MSHLFSLFCIYLTIFLFGMTIMRLGLYNLSGEKLKEHLYSFTSTPFKGLLIGAGVTAILQSSSAVLVLTIGLVATSYITFQQSVGIILGANIGTTVTAELITINIDSIIIPILFLGAFLMLQRQNRLFCSGIILFGLGCIFVAMNGFEELAQPLSSNYIVNYMLESSNANTFVGIFFGTILTAAIQSSTATTGIAMSFISENLLSLPSATAVILGANIGTCITGIIASIATPLHARLTAYSHVWINIFGVILCLPFITTLTLIAEKISTNPAAQLAHVSLLFNVITAFLGLLLIKPLTSFILGVHGKKDFE